jgi:hypothetical protein
MLDGALATIADISSSALWTRWRTLKALRERQRVADVFCSGGREVASRSSGIGAE